jgi:hypothetical protein
MGRDDDDPDPRSDDDGDAVAEPAWKRKGDPRIRVPRAFTWAARAAVAVIKLISQLRPRS